MKDKEDSELQHFVTGVQLDKFGELYSLRRIDESDTEYRLRLIEEFEKWFEGNESKFEYPRLAHKSAKQAWNYQQGEVDKLQTEIDELQNKVIDQQNAFDKLYDSYEATVDELVSYRSRFGDKT